MLTYVWSTKPSFAEFLFGSLLWALVVIASILGAYFLMRISLPPNTLRISIIFGAGGLISFVPALWLARIFQPQAKTAKFAVMFLLLSISTIGFTALILSADFWLYFSQWHAETFSRIWFLQFGFTFASALYQFLVSGLRLYLPFGLIALILASLWGSRRIAR